MSTMIEEIARDFTAATLDRMVKSAADSKKPAKPIVLPSSVAALLALSAKDKTLRSEELSVQPG